MPEYFKIAYRIICIFNCFIFVFGGTVIGNQCGQPEVPENGHIIFHNSGSLIAGVTVSYKCDIGFILIGPEQRVCQSNGTWSEHAPVCAINVALYKPALQSSTLFIGTIAHHANLSTDGNFDGICSSTKTATLDDDSDGHKKQQPSRTSANWWKVDLLETYRIYAVEILIPSPMTSSSIFENTNDEEMHIEIFASLHNSDEEESNTVCYKHKGRLETNQLHTFVCQRELNARHVQIVSKTPAPLQLCEVVILSTSAPSDWQCGTMSSMDSWGAFGGKCFYGSNEPMPWYNANSHCQMNGGSLVSEMNESLHKFLSAQARYRSTKNAQHFWLGLVMNGNREWTWIGGKAVEQEFWSNIKSRDTTITNMAYAAAMSQVTGWNWVPALQTLWYNWICQSKPRFCSGPGMPQNGGIMLSTQMYTIGASSFYYCNYGYVLKGAESRTCLENGTWSGRVPKCVAVDCGKVESPSGMKIQYVNESTFSGSKIEYRCPTGQKIVGAESRWCQSDGTWSDSAPNCIDVDCGWPTEVTNGKLNLLDNSTNVGSVAELTCDTGYGLIGPPIRHCAPNGLWMPSQTPYCYDINAIHNSLPQANGETWHNSSLMTGFVVAVIVLLLAIIIVLIWTWRKRKGYDGLSMSTLYAAATSQFEMARPNSSATPNTHLPELLYAFPTTTASHAASYRTQSPNNDGSTHYYVPSSIVTSNESNISKPLSDISTNQQVLSFLSADDLCFDSPRMTTCKTFRPVLMTNGGIPIPMAPPIIFAPTSGMDKPLFFAPVHSDRRKMENIINDIHLTVPNRRFGRKLLDMEMKRSSPIPASTVYDTIDQKQKLPPRKSIRLGAKTVGAKAGRTLNGMLTKVRRKISETNFNLLNGNNEIKEDIHNQPEVKSRGPYTLRINLTDPVGHVEANGDQSKISIDQTDRSISPTASELFGFDDDDNDEIEPNGATHLKIVQDNPRHGDKRVSGITQLSTFDTSKDEKIANSSYNNQNYEEDSKIYDLPPDASALIYGNLAKTLLKQSQIMNENIYETPSDAEMPTNETEASQKLEQVGIEIVHTYC